VRRLSLLKGESILAVRSATRRGAEGLEGNVGVGAEDVHFRILSERGGRAEEKQGRGRIAVRV